MEDGVSRTEGAQLLGEFIIVFVTGNQQIVIHDKGRCRSDFPVIHSLLAKIDNAFQQGPVALGQLTHCGQLSGEVHILNAARNSP